MTIHYRDDTVTVHAGDCIDILKTLPDNSIDAVVTDPPYGIRFMGKAWDGADIEARTQRGRETCPMPEGVGGPQGGYRSRAAEAGRYDLGENAAFGEWCSEWSAECLRVLKPGGHLAAFGGSRTWHRLASGVEDAGFEIRDSLTWLYGSGFPKSLDVSKAIDKAVGAEREPDEYTGPNNLNQVYGTGMGGGVTTRRGEAATAAAKRWQGWGTALKPAFEPIVLARKPIRGTVAANVVEHGTGALNIDACRVETTEVIRVPTVGNDMRGGHFASGHRPNPGDIPDYQQHDSGRWPTNVLLDETAAEVLDQQSGITRDGLAVNRNRAPEADRHPNVYGRRRVHDGLDTGYGGEGGASRFFPVFKYTAKAPGSERPTVDGVAHPTVKPLDLMRWLVRLITPPGGLVLDPFAGSGTTAEACVHEHMRCITIEREAEYLPLIVARLTKPMAVGFDFDGVTA